MARNLAIDNVRKLPQYADLESVENIVYSPAYDFSTKMDIEDAIKTLTLQENQIVSLHINGGFKFREIAEIMDITPHAARKLISRSMKRLREGEQLISLISAMLFFF